MSNLPASLCLKMTLWSQDFSYVELKSLVKWEGTWNDIRDELEDVVLHKYMSEYSVDGNWPEVDNMLREYGSDFKFYDLIIAQEALWCHVGAVNEVTAYINEPEIDIDIDALLEEAKDKICETVRTDIDNLVEKARRADKLWKSVDALSNTVLSNARVSDIIKVERELAILRREAATHPWSQVQSQFSFGTLRSN